MQFLYPSFLWALLAIAIPILIHLFHFRRFKNVYFPNIKFLKEIKEETSNRNKIKNLLVLLSRILAITALVLAFAQPFIPQGKEMHKGIKSISIYIDNSFSMDNLGEDISLLEKAKLDATKVVEAYDEVDKFQIVTNELSFIQQQWVNKEDAITRIEGVSSSRNVQDFSTILNRQREAFLASSTNNYLSYWLSDFQENIVNIEAKDLDSLIDYNVVLYKSIKPANISIDSCWWVAPIPVLGQYGSLIVRVRNYNTQPIEGLTINLQYNNQNYPLGKIDLPGNGSARDTLKFNLNKAGWNDAKIEISDYPVRFDDSYWLAFEVAETLPVLIISENGSKDYVRAVFNSSSIFEPEFLSVDAVNYTGLSKYKMILLEDVIQVSSGLKSVLFDYVNNGGNLMFFPGVTAEIAPLNEFLKTFKYREINSKEVTQIGVGAINRNEFVFQDVYEKNNRNISLPVVNQRFVLQPGIRSSSRQILGFKDGNSFIDASQIGKGQFYFCVTPLDISVNDLVKNAEIFVPMLYKMTMASNIPDRLSYTIGTDNVIEVNRNIDNSEIPFTISGEKEFLPTIRNVGEVAQLDVQGQIEKHGIYKILNKDVLTKKLAFNYNRKESDPSSLDQNTLQEILGVKAMIYDPTESGFNIKDNIIEKEKGLILWKWFIILALLFLGIEIMLLRFVKI